MIKRQACGGMANNDDGCAWPLTAERGNEAAYALDNVAIAFAVRKWCFNVQRAHSLDNARGGAVEITIVALSQSPIVADAYSRIAEGELGGLNGAA